MRRPTAPTFAMRPVARRAIVGMIVTLAALLLGACGELPAAFQPVVMEEPVTPFPEGDPQRGRELIAAYGCDACHQIPGVFTADADVGPPLGDMRTRRYIAGILPNTPENLIRWIMNPQDVEPRTAMPDLGVSEAQARDIGAYLYSLDGDERGGGGPERPE